MIVSHIVVTVVKYFHKMIAFNNTDCTRVNSVVKNDSYLLNNHFFNRKTF